MMDRPGRKDFVCAFDVGPAAEELLPALANYRALVWSRVTVAASKAEPELLEFWRLMNCERDESELATNRIVDSRSEGDRQGRAGAMREAGRRVDCDAGTNCGAGG